MPIPKKAILASFIGLIIGAVATTAVRYAVYKPDLVHYHANFALYVNDKRDEFDGPGFYEEVSLCSSDQVDNPRTRVHLHDNNPGLVHVHAHGVTWGQLFDNLGYTVGMGVLRTTQTTYVDDQDGHKLTFWLNGKDVSDVSDKAIKSEDRLLISYGNENKDALQKQFDATPKDAHKANRESDPATCSGTEKIGPKERFKHALGW